MNREEIVEKIAFGAGTVGNDFHHSPVQPYWPDDIPQHDLRPGGQVAPEEGRGREHLDRPACRPDRVFSGAVDMCVLYAEQAKRGRHDHQRGARAERRLLFRRLAEKAVLRRVVGRASDART
jgi:hypothetical protein